MVKRRFGEQVPIATNTEEASTGDKFNVWPFTVSEFMYIRKNFKTENLGTLEKFVEILKMWQWRANDEAGRIVLIDLTKLVFQGLVFDNRNVLHGMTDMRNQVDYAQYVYGTVLARFVNYINENYRHVNNTHGNMYDSTALVGLPRWVVTFRHDVVHSHMPKIDELRRAIFACRDWLYDTCWTQPIEIAFISLNSQVTRPRIQFTEISRTKVQDLLDKFSIANMAFAYTKDRNDVSKIILELKSIIFTDTKTVAIEIGERFIIKTKEQLKDMNFECVGENPWRIPTSWKYFWQDIILAVQECSVMGLVMIHLSNGVLCAQEDFFRVQYAAWLSHLIDKLKLTGFSIAYQHLSTLAENMLNSKSYHTRDKFLDIVKLMRPMLTEERKQNLIEKWDNDDEIACGINETVLEPEENENEHFGLITPNSSLGLIHDQRKDTLNLGLYI